MNTLSIIEQVKALGAHYASVIAMAELLERMGSIEQATLEAHAASAQAMNQRDSAVTELVRINALLENAGAELEKSKQDAAELISQAAAEANDLRIAARDAADSMMAVAKLATEEMQSQVDALHTEAADFCLLISEKSDELNSVTEKIAAAKAAMIAALG